MIKTNVFRFKLLKKKKIVSGDFAFKGGMNMDLNNNILYKIPTKTFSPSEGISICFENIHFGMACWAVKMCTSK